jgi:hypothetical protein
MQKLKKQKSLFELVPNLVREWHPSAIRELTPRSVLISYPRKVWWICNESHEWHATIKCRMKRRGCPICEEKATQMEPKASLSVETQRKADKNDIRNLIMPNVNLKLDAPYFGKNKRKVRRFKCKAIAVLKIPELGHWFYAETKNISSNGLSLETEDRIKPGTRIKVQIDSSLIPISDDRDKVCNSIIRWSKILDDDQLISSYRIGVEII